MCDSFNFEMQFWYDNFFYSKKFGENVVAKLRSQKSAFLTKIIASKYVLFTFKHNVPEIIATYRVFGIRFLLSKAK